MNKLKAFLALSLLAFAHPVPAQDTPLLIVGIGQIGLLDADDDEAGALGVEYRSPRKFLHVSPMGGFFVTAASAAYAYVGAYHDFMLGSRVVLSPHLSVGLYHTGGGDDLGGAFEFQPGIDLFYRLDSNARVGLTVRHLSNAGIHDNNPGTEVIMLLYAHPMSGR